MGTMFDVGSTVAEKPLACKKPRLKVLYKKPMINVSESTMQVAPNCSAKSASTDNQKTKCNSSVLGSKRMLEGAVDCQKQKRVKMDRRAILNCKDVLGKLMKHRNGCIFSEPVDPVMLRIPDYFDIIEHPMDLGTIKKKLDRSMYCDVREFESDVRLTFSNAMLYNPADNFVYKAAKELMRLFDYHWKPVSATIVRQCENVKYQSSGKKIDQSTRDFDKKCGRSPSSLLGNLSGQRMLPSQKNPEDLRDASLGKLHYRDAKAVDDGKAKRPRSPKSCRSDPDFSGHSSPPSGQSACGTSVQPQISHARPAHSIAKVKCEKAAPPRHTVHQNEFVAVGVKKTSASRHSTSDPDSDGVASCLDEEHACANSATTASVGAISEGTETVLDPQLSPSKALRAAMLKSRFAETILKARQKTLMLPGDKTDSVELRLEKERLDRKQREEKAKLEAQIRAAESAARFKAESELKKQREQQREAARLALEEMERSVDLDDNFHVLKELESLVGKSLFRLSHPASKHFDSAKPGSPLERLGLFIKAEYTLADYNDDDGEGFLQDGDLEEGEVIF